MSTIPRTIFHLLVLLLFFLLLLCLSSASVRSLQQQQQFSISLGSQFRITVNSSTPSNKAKNGRVRFFPVDNNNSQGTKQEAFWCADSSLSSPPYQAFKDVCTTLDMRAVVLNESTGIPQVDQIDSNNLGYDSSSSSSSSSSFSVVFFDQVSCSNFKSPYYAEDCTAQQFNSTTVASSSSSSSSVCSKVYAFYCTNYFAQDDPINAQANVFTSFQPGPDNGLLLYRPRSSKTFGSICGVGTSDPQKIADTARALCGMQGFRTVGAKFREYDPTKELPATSYSGIVSKRMYLANIVCPPHALSIANCSYDVSYAKSSTSGCGSGTNSSSSYPLRVQCVIPKTPLSPLIFRNGPSARLEVRSQCSQIWNSVCDDYFENEEAVAVCRSMSYDVPVSLASAFSPPLYSSADKYTAFYAAILSTYFLLDDVKCKDPRQFNFTSIVPPGCTYNVGYDNCVSYETLFLTPTADPAVGSARVERLCSNWTKLIEYNPWTAEQVMAIEDCYSNYYNNRNDDYSLSDLINSLSFQIFLVVLGSIVFLCCFCSCFGCSQYPDEELCQRYSTCCDNYCDDCCDFAFSRTVCCTCCVDDPAEYCCQGCGQVCENCINHTAIVCCCCGEDWPQHYQFPAGPHRNVHGNNNNNNNNNNAVAQREMDLQVPNPIPNDNNEAETAIAAADAAATQRQRQEIIDQEAQEAAGTLVLSLKPADVSTRYAMEQEAREAVIKLLSDLASNNVKESQLQLQLQQQIGFAEEEGEGEAAAEGLLGEQPPQASPALLNRSQTRVNNNNNNNNDDNDDDDGDDRQQRHQAQVTTPQNPLSGARALEGHHDDDVDGDDDHDEDVVDVDDIKTETLAANTTNTTKTAVASRTNLDQQLSQQQQLTIEVPFSLARWWTRDFAAKVDFDQLDESHKTMTLDQTQVFPSSPSSLLSQKKQIQDRLRKVFGGDAEFFAGYESFGGRFSLLFCVKKTHQRTRPHSYFSAYYSPLAAPYRNRIIEIARASNRGGGDGGGDLLLRQQQQQQQQQQKITSEVAVSSHEPIFLQPSSDVSATDENHRVRGTSAATASPSSPSSSSPAEASFSTFHFYRLADFYKKILKMTSANTNTIGASASTAVSPFASTYAKLNPQMLFDDNDGDDDGTAGGDDDEDVETPSDALTNTASVMTDDLDENDDEEIFEDKTLKKQRCRQNEQRLNALSSSSSSSPTSMCRRPAPVAAVPPNHYHYHDHHHHHHQLLQHAAPSWTFRCSICFGRFHIDLPSMASMLRKNSPATTSASDTVFPGAECSAPGRHFTCGPCLGKTISRLIEKGDVILPSLPCYNGDCAQSLGTVVLNDFSAVLELVVWRRWQDAIVERARLVGQREILRGGPLTKLGGSADARGQAERIREILKPKCPKCGLVFMSFTGCVQVRCIVGSSSSAAKQGQGATKGCGTIFCGACLKPQPCGKHSAHEFLSPAELHKAWAAWRKEKVVQFLQENFAPKSAAARDVLVASQNLLVAASIWPLSEPWKLE